MTKSLISNQYLSDIADAIRQKKGTSGTIKTYELSDEIASITGGGVEFDTSLTLTSDKERTTGAVTLSATLNDEYSETGITNTGLLENAPISLYKNNTLLATQNTNSNGVATFNQTINEDTTFTATYNGESGKYETSTATKTIQYTEYLYHPSLDGTETLYTINGTSQITNHTLTGSSCAYLTSGWNYQLNWELECDFLFTGSSLGIIVCPTNITGRDKNWIQVGSESSGLGRFYNGYQRGRNSLSLSNHTWYHYTLTKNGNNFTYTIGDNISGSFSFNATDWSTVSIGIDYWGGSATATLKNITVKEI